MSFNGKSVNHLSDIGAFRIRNHLVGDCVLEVLGFVHLVLVLMVHNALFVLDV